MKRRDDRLTMPLTEAASVLGMSVMYLRDLLREGKMREIGFAVEKGGSWRYYVYRDNVEKLRNGSGRPYDDPTADDGR